MVNAQEWLNKEHSKKSKTNDIFGRNKDLEGKLTIEGYEEVQSIDLSSNKKLTRIEIKDLPKLTRFWVNGCGIKDIEIENCSNISDFNVFSPANPRFLSKFVNLKGLYIDNCDKSKFEKGIYNRWHGSLAPLKNMSNLRWLAVNNTDIDSGLEYLPESLRKIGCNSEEWESQEGQQKIWGCSKILEELKGVAKISGVTERLQGIEKGEEYFMKNYHRLAPWRQVNILLINQEISQKRSKNAVRKERTKT